MVKKTVLSVVVVMFFFAAPRPAVALCVDKYGACIKAAVLLDSVWSAWFAYCDCELDYIECMRISVIGS
jgi:hypothetical protein